ncbi:MAG: MotA/TolQ/ExbB proton channel family protein [Lysobacteraceae bacterium]
MWELIKSGGWTMVPILLCGAFSVAIILERFWSLRRREVIPATLGEEVRQWVRGGRLEAAHIETLRKNSPLGELLAAVLDVRHRPHEQVKERVEDAGRHIAHDLERFLNPLGTIAGVAPLLGLLGTVFGMIRMFFGILSSGVGDAMHLAGGIGEVLVSTAAGLCVAIPSLLFHRYFRSRVAAYLMAMEKQAMALIDTLEGSGSTTPRARRSGK